MGSLNAKGRVPLTKAVKRSLAFVAAMFGIAGAVEIYMLANPDEIAPISWAFWYLGENAAWLPAVLSGVSGGFMSHFWWYLKPGNFWHPIRLRSALIVGVATLGSTAAVQAWGLLLFEAAFMISAVLAHRCWYRIDSFDEHLAQFHDDDGEEH